MCRVCSVEGCNNKHTAKGYCDKHYRQYKKYGKTQRTVYDSNEIIEYDDYAELVLYDKHNNEVARAIIDLEYVDVVKQYKWHLNTGYVHNSKVGLLHRLIMNPDEDMVVDHINHNRLDNRISNLRICTSLQNNMNSGKRCDNISGITGVTWYKDSNKWVAYIRVNGKRKNLGYYKTLEEAKKARRQAEIDYYGEFSPNRED